MFTEAAPNRPRKLYLANREAFWSIDDDYSEPDAAELKEIQTRLGNVTNKIASNPHFSDLNVNGIRSISSCTIDHRFGLEVPFKMVPFFFNNLSGPEMQNVLNMDKTHLSMNNCKARIVVQGHLMRNTQSISGFEEFRDRVAVLHKDKNHMMVNELQKIDITSAIKLIVQVRLYFDMKLEDYQAFLQSGYPEGNQAPSTLNAYFKNCLSNKARKEFMEGGIHLEDKELAFLQSLSLMGEREKQIKREEIDKLFQMSKLLKDYTMIEEIGLATKSYITAENDRIELRLDFKFPTTSLDSFELEIESLKLL